MDFEFYKQKLESILSSSEVIELLGEAQRDGIRSCLVRDAPEFMNVEKVDLYQYRNFQRYIGKVLVDACNIQHSLTGQFVDENIKKQLDIVVEETKNYLIEKDCRAVKLDGKHIRIPWVTSVYMCADEKLKIAEVNNTYSPNSLFGMISTNLYIDDFQEKVNMVVGLKGRLLDLYDTLPAVKEFNAAKQEIVANVSKKLKATLNACSQGVGEEREVYLKKTQSKLEETITKSKKEIHPDIIPIIPIQEILALNMHNLRGGATKPKSKVPTLKAEPKSECNTHHVRQKSLGR